jgi:glycosyltransferase involved in cell wall biosynthesis
MSSPLVSVVVPTRNRAELLARAVASVRAQTMQDLELIIVDDGSTDDTSAYLARLTMSDARVRVQRNAVGGGGSAARNAGIALASGRWVAFLDDDDEWLPAKLERQLAMLAANPDAVACSCDFEQHFPSGRMREFRVRREPTLQEVLYDNVLGGASVCVAARDVLLGFGGFDTRLRSAQDYDLWVQLRHVGRIVVCPECLVKYSEHDGVRITNQLSSQYLGTRRLHLKYRRHMDAPTRRYRLSFVWFLQSRQTERSLGARLRRIWLAATHSPPRIALSYVAHSMNALRRDLFA